MSQIGVGKGILITTSRRPSPRTRSLVKDLVAIIPRSMRANRGHFTMEELATVAAGKGCDRLVVLSERRGNPSIMRIYEIKRGLSLTNIVSIKIRGLSLSRELRRPLPSPQPAEIYVKVENDDIMDFAEALILGLHAKLYYKDLNLRGNVVIALLQPDKRGEATVLEFMNSKGEYVGPKLRILRTSRMIKDDSR